MSELIRSTVGLREGLFEEWESLRNGTSNPARARSVAAMANSILASVQVEIEYHKYVRNLDAKPDDKKAINFDGTKIMLGTDKTV